MTCYIMNRYIVLLLVLCVGFVSAHDVGYKERFVETRIIEIDYDNDDRHSTYDYRHGYSYRTTRDYFEEKHEDVFSRGDRFERSRNFARGHDLKYQKGLRSGLKGSYYEYVPHMRSYEKHECYLTAPAGKLFYVRCP
jgi:hypothetical protein